MPLASKLMKPVVCLAVVTAGYAGCGEDGEKASSPPKAAGSAAVPSAASSAAPDVENLKCGEVEFGLTSTDTVYLVSAVSRKAGVDVNTAAKTIRDVCKRGRPRTKPYPRAVSILGGQ